MSSEIEYEAIPGLPHELPAGERLLWQGRPRWQGLARHTFRVPWLAAYFAVFIAARLGFALYDGQGLGGALLTSLMVLPLALICLGMLSLLAYLNARATIYTITSRRVVLRLGVALPMTFNLPFKRLAAAHLNLRRNGEGDIALQLSGPDRIAWLHLWPHARPFHLAKAQPMLRAIPAAAAVATLLAEAVQDFAVTAGAPVLLSELAAVAPGSNASPGPGQPEAAAVGLGSQLVTQLGQQA